jgi:hypothetical protein
MGIGISLVFLAAGAILKFAVSVSNTNGVNVNNIGVILMIVGAIGIVLSLIFWSTLGFGHRDTHETVIHDR